MKNISNLIFDFDGTLANSYDVFLSAFEIVALEFNLKTENLKSHELKNLGTREILNELGIKKFQLPFITKRGREEMWNRREELKLFPDVEETLRKLLERKVTVAILTSNSSELVHYLIPASLLKEIIVLKPSALFGKAGSIRKFCKDKNINKAGVAYVGDETRDIDAAKDAGIQSIAVSYGYNSKDALLKVAPNVIIDNFKSLLNLTK